MPELEEEAVWYYAAWQALSVSRPAGFAGPMPIPLSEVEAYCRLAGVSVGERLTFARLIRQVDLGFLELLDKRKAATTGSKG